METGGRGGSETNCLNFRSGLFFSSLLLYHSSHSSACCSLNGGSIPSASLLPNFPPFPSLFSTSSMYISPSSPLPLPPNSYFLFPSFPPLFLVLLLISYCSYLFIEGAEGSSTKKNRDLPKITSPRYKNSPPSLWPKKV